MSDLIKKAQQLASFYKAFKTEFINGREGRKFISLVEGKVDHVIDVRFNTFYKSKQGFGPQNLKRVLREIGIKYSYFHLLGNPFHKLYSKEEFVAAKVHYLKYIENNPGAKKTLDDLFNLIPKKRITKIYCIICYCATTDSRMCHRFWLFEALMNLKKKELGLEQNYVLNPHDQHLLINYEPTPLKIEISK